MEPDKYGFIGIKTNTKCPISLFTGHNKKP